MRRNLLVLLALLASVAMYACLGGQNRDEPDAVDPRRRCGLSRGDAELPDLFAVRCAEWFVARQGYTEQPSVADSTAVAYESIEFAESTAELLMQRRGTLESRAMGVCQGGARGSAWTVVFWNRGRTGARAVTLDEAFGSLRVEHVDFRPEAITEGVLACRSLPKDARRAGGH